ncbi:MULTISPECIES: LysR substrate-binding domain-containing protein [unclassified Rhizobium]|uniref:LysR substrate-binding domain-containing protein n=1 Tax=unclassified Rhizobium TaxID=2613769 RepID=UPI000EA9D434|nr:MULTISPECIES: LysR substrate-binding domain-containing protein [unclassified Rhizobium]AYG65294.1 LysR family transcriptional regulator [Rhizobium sp. CCGE531]AYG71778.1 LysR family transcriptional regulator [Rhizobium sp. CCGE532]
MSERPPRRLPPLNALRAFDAVARRGSILKAADELGVVRGAVRQQLNLLETHFGMTLFDRENGRLVLTAKGKAFADSVGVALGILARASADLSIESRRSIRLGVPSAFVVWWLMPRAAGLQAALQNIDMDIVPMATVEPLAKRPDLEAVIMGGEYRPTRDITAIRFMEDEFGPVTTPELADRLGLSADVSVLAGAVALASRSAPSLWEDWFAESGHAPLRFAGNREFEDLLLAIGAARSGLGVAIAPRTAVGDDIDRGTLVAPYGFIRRPAGYSLCIRSGDVKDSALVRLADWLSRAGAEGI